MANVTCYGCNTMLHDGDDELSVVYMLQAFEALSMLLGGAGLYLLQSSIHGMCACPTAPQHRASPTAE